MNFYLFLPTSYNELTFYNEVWAWFQSAHGLHFFLALFIPMVIMFFIPHTMSLIPTKDERIKDPWYEKMHEKMLRINERLQNSYEEFVIISKQLTVVATETRKNCNEAREVCEKIKTL